MATHNPCEANVAKKKIWIVYINDNITKWNQEGKLRMKEKKILNCF